MTDVVCRRLEWILGAACALLIAWLLWNDVSASNPWDREQVNIQLGLWSTRLLIALLVISPLSHALRRPGLRRMRRVAGLSMAALSAVHAVQYLIYSQAWPSRLYVLFHRPYLTFGTIALVLLLPLAATSTKASVLRLGPRSWRRLHWLIYPAAVLSVLHELMAGTALFGEAGIHAAAITLLLLIRLVSSVRKMLSRTHPLWNAGGSPSLRVSR